MRRIHWLVLKSFIGPFVATFFIVIFILLMQFVWKYIDDMVGKGLEWTIIAQLLFYSTSTFVPLALPLAILLSSLMTFGNLGENLELTAAKSSGISLFKMLEPLILLVIILSISAFLFSNFVMPIANLKAQTLLFDVRQKKQVVNIKPGIFYTEIDNYVIRIGDKDEDNKTIHDIIIYDHTKRVGNSSITIAESGKMEFTPDKRFLIFTLNNGYNFTEKVEGRRNTGKVPLQRTRFKKEVRRIDLSSFAFQKTNEEFFKDHYQMMNIFQLRKASDSMRLDISAKYLELNQFIYNNFNTLKTKNIQPNPSAQQNPETAVNNAQPAEEIQRQNFLFQFKELTKQKNNQTGKKSESVKSIDTLHYMAKPFLDHFSKEERLRIVDVALSKARDIQNNIDYYESDERGRKKSLVKYEVEWHRKFTLSFACLVLFFIGAPLGAIIRKGGLGLPLVVSVLMFLAFHILSMTGEKLAKDFVVSPAFGMWISSAILLPLGIFLSWKAITDSPLLDAEAWSKPFNRLTKIVRKKSAS